MSEVARIALTRAQKAWTFLRAVMGDQAYERYLEVAQRRGEAPLSAQEYYLESIKRRYSTVSRCC